MAVPKTWEQLESDAASLVKAGKVKYGFVFEGNSYEGGTCDFMEYYADTGGQVLNSTDPASVLSIPDVTKVLTFVHGLVSSGASPAAVDTFEEGQAMTPSTTARPPSCATGTMPTRRWPTPRAWRQWESGRRPLPTFAGDPYPGYSNIGGWNLYITPTRRT